VYLLVKTEVQAVMLDKQMVELEWNYLPDSVADSTSKKNLGDSITLNCKFQKMVYLWVFYTH
jgi:hypothetical protein